MSLDGGGRMIRHLGIAGALAMLAACSGSALEGAGRTPPSSTGAPAGIVDSRFGQGGAMVLGTSSDDAFQAILGTASGELIAIGSSTVDGRRAFLVTRLHADGSADPQFGTGGRVVTTVGQGNAEAWAGAISADGRITVAGSAGGEAGDADIALARYLPDGRTDPTFGRDGVVVTNVSGGADTAFAVTTDAGSRTVVAGQCGRPNQRDNTRGTACLLRYDSSGRPDTSFGAEGVRPLPIRDGVEALRGVSIDGRGRIVATGYSAYATANELTLFRLTTNGELDESFGDLGQVSYRGRGFTDGFALSVVGDGVLVAGFTGQLDGSDKDFLVARFSEDGRLDRTFGEEGAGVAPIGAGDDVAFALVAGPRGIVLAGFSFNGAHNDVALARFSVDGELDPGFGDGGTLTIPVGSTAVVRGLVVQGATLTLAGEVTTAEGTAALLARVSV